MDFIFMKFLKHQFSCKKKANVPRLRLRKSNFFSRNGRADFLLKLLEKKGAESKFWLKTPTNRQRKIWGLSANNPEERDEWISKIRRKNVHDRPTSTPGLGS